MRCTVCRPSTTNDDVSMYGVYRSRPSIRGLPGSYSSYAWCPGLGSSVLRLPLHCGRRQSGIDTQYSADLDQFDSPDGTTLLVCAVLAFLVVICSIATA